MKVEFYLPTLDPQDKKNVLKVLDSGFLSTWGTVKKFEEDFSKYLHVPHTVGVMSCTAALHLSLLSLGVGKGDEVITTPISFVATANAIELAGAKPVFVDVEKETGNIDATKIPQAITKKTKAIIPVHLYGHMADMKAITRISKKYKIPVIEDAAHAVEAMRDGYRPGQLSYAACFSFHSLKNITSGEGGAIVVNDEKLAHTFRLMRLHGLVRTAADQYKKFYRHNEMELLGWKANMSEMQAALLLHQLEMIEKRWKMREKLVLRYENGFRRNPHIQMMGTLSGVKHAHHLFTVLVEREKRDFFLHTFQEHGVGVAVNFVAIPFMKYYREKYGYKPGTFPVAEDIGARTITLPLYPRLKTKEQDYVIKTINELTSSIGHTKGRA